MKTIPGDFAFVNEENKSKEIQGKNVSSFTKLFLGGLSRGILSRRLLWGFMSRGF